MTVKLYEQDAYCRAFEAVVLSCEPCKRGFAVVLDRTAFFPEGGGQPADRGTLGGAAVADVQIENGIVTHTVECPLTAGETVHGEIDWPCRFARMQHHTGEHLISGLLHTLYGLDNVGFHLNDTLVTLDVSGPLDAQQIAAAELAANRAVYENRAVTACYPLPAELPTLTYRRKLDLTEGVRLITVEGYDMCACCAPHVKRTGEIGLIKIVGAAPYKGGMRLEMVCGERAFADYAMLHGANGELMHLLSAPRGQVAAFVRREHDTVASLREEIARLHDRLALAQLETVALDGVVCAFTRDASAEALRACVEHVGNAEGFTAVFSLCDDGTASYALAHPHGDVRETVKALNAAFNGRGGGKPAFAQGRLTADKEALLTFFKH